MPAKRYVLHIYDQLKRGDSPNLEDVSTGEDVHSDH